MKLEAGREYACVQMDKLVTEGAYLRSRQLDIETRSSEMLKSRQVYILAYLARVHNLTFDLLSIGSLSGN